MVGNGGGRLGQRRKEEADVRGAEERLVTGSVCLGQLLFISRLAGPRPVGPACGGGILLDQTGPRL
jgi:hypothetical protein